MGNQRGSVLRLTRQAVRQSSDLTPRQKLALQLALLGRRGNEQLQQIILDTVVDQATAFGITIHSPEVSPQFDLDDLERLFQLIIKYLPQIIELIEKFFLSSIDVSSAMEVLPGGQEVGWSGVAMHRAPPAVGDVHMVGVGAQLTPEALEALRVEVAV